MHRVLITGGAGFIGSNFIRYLLNTNPDVFIVNLDALTYSGNLANLDNLPDAQRYEFIHGNICDRALLDQLLTEHCIDTIIHFAAESHVDRSITGPMKFIETNVIGTASLLEAARAFWLKKDTTRKISGHFHHISTDEVFGSLLPGEPAFQEETLYSPRSPYAASKAASDLLVRSYFHTYNLPITITNCSNNYGPYQFPEKLIPLMIQNALRGKKLPVYGDGKQVRDWLYVEDHCSAIIEVIENGTLGETYNIGGNNQPTNLEIVTSICAILDEIHPESPFRPHSNLIQFVSDRPGHDRRYAMDISKMNAEFKWLPRVNLESGLKQTIRWYLDHQDWVEKIENSPEYQDWIKQNYSGRG